MLINDIDTDLDRLIRAAHNIRVSGLKIPHQVPPKIPWYKKIFVPCKKTRKQIERIKRFINKNVMLQWKYCSSLCAASTNGIRIRLIWPCHFRNSSELYACFWHEMAHVLHNAEDHEWVRRWHFPSPMIHLPGLWTLSDLRHDYFEAVANLAAVYILYRYGDYESPILNQLLYQYTSQNYGPFYLKLVKKKVKAILEVLVPKIEQLNEMYGPHQGLDMI